MTPEERFKIIEQNLQAVTEAQRETETNLKSISERLDILTRIHLDSARDQEERLRAAEKAIKEMQEGVKEMRETAKQIALYTVSADRLFQTLIERSNDHERRLDDLEGK